MRHAAGEQIELVLRTLPSGKYCIVWTNKATAELFGLLDHYDKLEDVLADQHGWRGHSYVARRLARPRGRVSRRITVIRQVPEGSETKIRSHSFRLSNKVSLFDIAELAHFIGVDWHFLVGPDGRRHDRAWWEGKYQEGPLKESVVA